MQLTTGKRIKLHRIAMNIKQYQMAKDIGISKEYLRLIESDQATNPSRDLMIKIAGMLGTTVGELFFSEDDK
ncbi:MAG: helix-turn-helix domain-containing protein [Youngiibacter sp.]|nr:helix-turn-helix domain-containing protein [Youngiibacter sp.]